MEQKSSYSFLLGGHDLEMAEIRRIFEAKGISFYDNNLGWNSANIDQLELEIFNGKKPIPQKDGSDE